MTQSNKNDRSTGFILLFFLACFGLRLFEYFVLRTDRTIIGEAFVHKVLGIVLLAWALRRWQLRWGEIGFGGRGALSSSLFGAVLVLIPLAIAYAIEMAMLNGAGEEPRLGFFVASYSITGNTVMEQGPVFLLICILGNLINVVMEEGVFRGLFLKLGDRGHSLLVSMLLSSLLFGIWHIAAPLRSLLDGDSSLLGALMASLVQILLTGLTGFMLAMLARITGSLWAPMAAHFANNFASNVVHVTSLGGIDQMQVMRISIAQSLAFLVVLALYIRHRRREKAK